MRSRWFRIGAAALVGIAAGFIIAWYVYRDARPARVPISSATATAQDATSSARLTADGIIDATKPDDLPAAVQHCLNLDDPVLRSALAGAYLEKWFRSDSAGAIAFLQKNDPSMSGDLWGIAARVWGKVNFGEALSFIRSNARSPTVADALIMSAVNGYAQVDLHGAGIAVPALPFTQVRERALEFIGKSYAARDVNAGLEWARALPITRGQTRAMEALGIALSRKDPRAAAEIALAQGTPDVRLHLMRETFQNWGRINPSEAQAYLNGDFKDPRMRSQMLGQVFRGWAKASPADAAAAANNIKDPASAYELNMAVSSEWAAQDPKAAADWVLTLSDDQTKRGAMVYAVNNLIDTGTNAALQWIAQIPDPALRDHASAITCSKLTFEFPELSVELANSISDAKTRRGALDTIDAKWLTLDHATAKKLRGLMKF